MAARRARAERRLQRDLHELAERSWELPTVSALPLDDDMLEWHCNVVGTGECEGVVLHMKLLFPETYPHQPPEVVLMSRVCHPNVFGDHLCLDMLEEGQWADAEERDAEFTGWSTAYSVFTVLMQLQAFIFDAVNDASKTRGATQRCECFCGHGYDRVYPPLPRFLPPPPRPPVAQDPFGEAETEQRRELPEEVVARVVRMERWGALLRLEDDTQANLRRAEIPKGCWLEPGDRVTCRAKEKRDPPRPLELTLLRTEQELSVYARTGDRMQGTVTAVKPYGAFVDIGGHSGLLHRSEMELLPRQPIPLEQGEMVSVRLLGPPGGRLSFSSRALYLRPMLARPILDGEVDLGRLRCFHSKQLFSEAVLGVGVSLIVEEVNGQERGHLSSIYDTLALDSFKDGVRKGVWKQEFKVFLPLALDAEHFQRAMPALQASLARLASGAIAEKTRSHGKSRQDKENEVNNRISLDEYRRGGALAKPPPPSLGRPEGAPFEPAMILEVVPKLMNSQVVLLSSGQLWRCQKALEGYFAYHHLLLHCLRAFPKLRASMEGKLERFMADPESRTKERVHNLGEFICLLSLSDRFGWDDLGIPILEETFDRNVLWILKQSPQLGDLSDAGVSHGRLRRSFNATRVSLRLLMFQVAFLQLVKPPHAHAPDDGSCRAASCALDRKDRCKGLPGPGEAEWLFQRCLDILAVEDYSEFLELVGAMPMTDGEICRWLRRSMLRSISKGYHNPRIFASLAAKARAPKTSEGGPQDPEDFGLDTRAKESKAAKRARRQALLQQHALASRKSAEFQKALWFARFFGTGGYEVRQAAIFVDEAQWADVRSRMDDKGELLQRYHAALRGYKLLDGMTPAKVKKFPVTLWFGYGCTECSSLVRTEISGRCFNCCVRLAKAPAAPRPIKGLEGSGAPVQQFTMFQAQAINPVVWEVHYEVKFAGLVADISPLHASLDRNLRVTGNISGGVVFSYVERAGKRLWEKSPEQVICPGAKLISGFQGVTECVAEFRPVEVRGVKFTLLKDTMHEMRTDEDLALLKMTRTYCRDHLLREHPVTGEVREVKDVTQAKHTGPKREKGEDEVNVWKVFWDRPCKNCRGILRMRFAGPTRFAERQAQLNSLTTEQLAQRASLCGVSQDVAGAEQKKEAVNLIIKTEGIIR